MDANDKKFEVELAAEEDRKREPVKLDSEAAVKLQAAMTAKEAKST